MKGVNRTKLIILQPSPNHKQGGSCFTRSFSVFAKHHRHPLWLVALLSFTFASLLALLNTSTSRPANVPASSVSQSAGEVEKPLPAAVFDALVDYAAGSTSPGKMNEEDLRAVAGVLRRRAPCNLLVFGIGHETPLWRALNYGGRTVFVDESEYLVGQAEGRNLGLEAYDVAFTTTVRGTPELLAAARRQRRGDCRPVQNLLYSDCRLAVNNLPNQLYGVAWGVILVDGPQGQAPEAPGRASSIFTAAVMARSASCQVDVLVHDYDREVERVSSGEFLCPENLVGGTPRLAHFVIRAGAPTDEFCHNNKTSRVSWQPSPAGNSASS
ncbi:protein IRX15-LIKE-like [Curcuma longa]|uniref:protein IRX15-LIKE-like n=1 Tax=Curcuma longa TaxID=136217 RepID=UPI003D9E8C31